MLFKKRWSDGLTQDFGQVDEFEAKFYCFGGDGGGNGGGGGSSKPSAEAENKLATAQEPARGRPTSAAVQEKISEVTGRPEPVEAMNAPVQQEARALSLTEMFPDAVVEDRFSISQPSFTQKDPTKVSYGLDLGLSDFTLDPVTTSPQNIDVPTPNFSPASNLNPALQSVVDRAQDLRNINKFDIGPGTLTISPQFDLREGITGGSIEYNMPLGGGISSLSNPMVDAITQGMNRARNAPAAPTTDLAFTDTLTNVYGTLTSPETYVGNNLVRRGNTYTSASSGGRSSTRREPSMYDKITSTGKTMADQVGLGSLFN